MLFSDDEVANYVNQNFESTWKAVRPVPKVSIDFGNGNVVNRTLHGNIATFVCAKDGTVVDVIAGLNSRQQYLTDLNTALDCAKSLSNDKNERDRQLQAYHRKQLAAAYWLAASDSTPRSTAQQRDDFYNAKQRKKQIEEKLLADSQPVKPQDMTKWLYKEVLHADLDDPYLGLKETLFATYPFKEDRSL